jgi:hypothetical protein
MNKRGADRKVRAFLLFRDNTCLLSFPQAKLAPVRAASAMKDICLIESV